MRGLRQPAVAALAVAIAVTAVVAALAGGGEGGSARAARAPERVLLHGVGLQSASCDQWIVAEEQERRAVVRAIRAAVAGPTPGGPATTLPDDAAYALFERACKRREARHFLLYELYIRAAGYGTGPGDV